MTACRLHELVYGQPLTWREQMILERLSRGDTSNEIAARMGLAYNTIHEYRKFIVAKLGALNTAHAVAIGFDLGLLE